MKMETKKGTHFKNQKQTDKMTWANNEEGRFGEFKTHKSYRKTKETQVNAAGHLSDEHV